MNTENQNIHATKGRTSLRLMSRVSRLVSAFLLSPWGLILPTTAIVLLLVAMQLEKLTEELAEAYARRLIDCSESEIDEIVTAIVRLGDSGVPSLVGGLRSERESVFFACQNALERNLDFWTTQRASLQNEHYLRLTESLLKEVDGFKTTALTTTAIFVDRILRETIRQDAKNSAEVVANCERLFDNIQSTRKRLENPNGSSSASTSDAIVRQHRSIVDPTMIAAEEPVQEIDGDFSHVDEFATPRAKLLYAYHQSATFQQQAQTPHRRPGNDTLPSGIVSENPESSQNEMVASMGPGNGTFALVEPQGKVAQRFETESDSNVDNIAENYITNDRLPLLADRNGKPSPIELPSINTELPPITEPYDFLLEELKRISLEKIPTLSTTKLMRLLQHADDQIVAEARKTLVGRDGFQEMHLKLAFRLYHPHSVVRAELVDLLPGVGGIRQSVWLTELLNDPNADVRFLAASALATSSDPSMQRLLVEKGKRDPDPRIVELAEQVQDRRRTTRR